MTTFELMSVVGLFAGPVAAVAITLWRQSRDDVRGRQLQTLRMLINTRHMVADPGYSVAINMIPFDFSKNAKIMAAWDKYMDVVFFTPSAENRTQHDKDSSDLQTKLIFEIAKFLGYQISEVDLQRRAYAAQSFVDRDQLGIQAQVAWIRIANALEQQNNAAGLPDAPTPEDLIPEQPASPVETPK